MKRALGVALALSIALAPTQARVAKRDSGEWLAKDAQILAACHPKQRDFVLDEGRRVVALVGRGGGKTTGICARFIRRLATTRRAKCLYVATTRDQAIELLWDPLKDKCERLGINAKFNETRLICTFLDTRSTVRLVGADDKRQIEKYRGIPFHEVWIDECASYPVELLENLIDRIIGPRLGDFGGMLGLVGTPGHYLAGEFYEASRPGSPFNRRYEDRDDPDYADWDNWSLHTWTLEDGAPFVPAMARLWAEALVNKRNKGWSDKNPIWLREYRGQWASDDTDHVYRYQPHTETGEQWNQWIPEIDPVTKFAKLPADLIDPQFVYGSDFGHTDPTAIQIFAYSLQDPKKRLIHCYDFSKREMYPKTIAELLIGPKPEDPTIQWPNHENPGGLLGVTGWPASMVADPKSLARGYIAEFSKNYGIHMKLADQNEKMASIEATNGDLIDGRLWIMKGSTLETQLVGLQWKQDDNGQVKEDPRQRNDAADCLIYARREAYHLIGLDAPQEKADGYSPYSENADEFPSEGANNEFGDLLGDGGFDSNVWG